ncbi:MAG: membrane protein [Rhodomicrobium sp.]|nr:MAG: membrane protein [Rhodomicrobium sp.]
MEKQDDQNNSDKDARDQQIENAASLSSAEIGAIAHLYRGEVYRSTIWRTRLDNTTNWAVVSLGLALSITYSTNEATPLPLILVGFLIAVFLGLEARRYRYFNVWRARARWMEKYLYVPFLRGEGQTKTNNWQEVLAENYLHPHYHISYVRAVGRRLRRNYIWIFLIQAVAYYGKMAVHPTAITSWEELWQRASIGPLSGQVVIALGMIFYALILYITLVTYIHDHRKHKDQHEVTGMG